MLCMFARMWNGDIITPDLEVTINEEPVVKAAELMRKMYVEGIIPSDWHTYGYAQSIKIFREGRAAMILEASNYWPTFNDPDKSKVAGDARPAPLPLAKEYATAERDFSAGSVWFWSQAILKGSQDKDLAYEYIRHLNSQESALNMALSGNPPARIDVLSDPRYLEKNPGAEIDAMVAPYTATWIPAFENMIEVSDICGEAVHNIVVEGRPAQRVLDAAAEKIEPLLP